MFSLVDLPAPYLGWRTWRHRSSGEAVRLFVPGFIIADVEDVAKSAECLSGMLGVLGSCSSTDGSACLQTQHWRAGGVLTM